MESLRSYLKITEAAALLGVAPNTLRTWAQDGKIPMRRNPINGYRLFRRMDLEKLLKQATQDEHATKSQPRRRPR